MSLFNGDFFPAIVLNREDLIRFNMCLFTRVIPGLANLILKIRLKLCQKLPFGITHAPNTNICLFYTCSSIQIVISTRNKNRNQCVVDYFT